MAKFFIQLLHDENAEKGPEMEYDPLSLDSSVDDNENEFEYKVKALG